MKASRILDDRQFRLLLRAAASRRYKSAARDHFLIYFLGKTGLRVSEALALTVGDLWLGPEAAEELSFVRVCTLKRRGATPRDEVLITQGAARRCRHYVRATLPALLARPVTESDPLFPAMRRHRKGQALRRRAAHAIFKTYVRLAGLPPTVTVHSLRHYRGTFLMRHTGNPEFVRQQLRHRSLRSTQEYQHVTPDVRDEYLRRLEDD